MGKIWWYWLTYIHMWEVYALLKKSIPLVFMCILALTFSAFADDVNKGDIARFGTYEQDNNAENGTEPIEWVVLSVDGEKTLLISQYVIDTHCFDRTHRVSEDDDPIYYSVYAGWDKSDIRAWLNDTFLHSAFDETEQAQIVPTTIETPDCEGIDGGDNTIDQVFLLSVEEAKSYLRKNGDLLCIATEYAVANGAFHGPVEEGLGGIGTTNWWLRSPGTSKYVASAVLFDGSIIRDGWHVKGINGGVRPALWLQTNAVIQRKNSRTSPDEILYYNPDGGSKYHTALYCLSTNSKYLPYKGKFTYAEINDEKYSSLQPCHVCGAPGR